MINQLMFLKHWSQLDAQLFESCVLVASATCSIVYLCKYFPPDVCPCKCMQGTHKPHQQRRDCGAMPACICDNQCAFWKSPRTGKIFTKIDHRKDEHIHTSVHASHDQGGLESPTDCKYWSPQICIGDSGQAKIEFPIH